MFARYYADKAAKAETTAAVETHIVRDRYTHNVLIQGTKEKCQVYVAAFANCYVDQA